MEGLLVSAESKLSEAQKQYDAMLESKQSELSRHLKEISQRNDQVTCFYMDIIVDIKNSFSFFPSHSLTAVEQAINEIRKKYEIEKLEITNAEKEKVG